jgi:parallel beta-helix repeat protein
VQGTTPGNGSGAITTHETLDYVEAHKLNNRNGVYYSVNYGIVGGPLIDESNNILSMLDSVGQSGGGTCVIRAVNPLHSIYINKTISVYYSNVHLVFKSPVVYGASGSIRIMGQFDEYSNRPGGSSYTLQSSTTLNSSNQTVLTLKSGQGSTLAQGMKLVIRGQNDASGKAIFKDSSYIASISGDVITLTDELDYTFDPTYPNSEWPPDLTTGTTIYIVRYSSFTTNITSGATSAVCSGASTNFAVGDFVMVSDSRNEFDMNSSAVTQSGVPYKNPANLEFARIVALDAATNTVTFDHALRRSYNTANYGGISKVLPVQNSTISGVRATYNADQLSRSINTLQITYAVNCHAFDNVVDGSGGRRSHAIRISYAYMCSAYRNIVRDAKFYNSGEGYGITVYYSSNCSVYANKISGCRHNILLQLATAADIYDNDSIDDRISGIDLHGVHSQDCHIYNNRISRSALFSPSVTNGSGIRNGNTSHSGGDHGTLIENNIISGYQAGTASLFAIDVIPASRDVTVKNNTITDAYTGFRLTPNSKQVNPPQTVSNLAIVNNKFTRCSNRAIEVIGRPNYDNVNSNGKCDKLLFKGNVSDSNSKHFEFSGLSGGGTNSGLQNVTVEDNVVINPISSSSRFGVSVKDISGVVRIHRNTVSGCNRGIELVNTNGARVTHNNAHDILDGSSLAYVVIGNTSPSIELNSPRTFEYLYNNPWVTLTLNPPWFFSAIYGWHEPSYQKDSEGKVSIRGIAFGGSPGVAISTLPVGFRPTVAERFAVVAGGAFGFVDIGTAGTIVLALGDNSYVSLSNISFYAGL